MTASSFESDLLTGLRQALDHVEGREVPGAVVHSHPSPREIRRRARLTQSQMAPLMGMSLSGYRKIEQGQRGLQGAAAVLLRVLDREPEAVRRALRLDPAG